MINPLFWLDLRVRVRERRLWVIAVFFLAVPAVIGLLSMFTVLSGAAPDPGNVGTTVSMCAIFCQAALLVILSPLAAAQRISQEREQRTFAALVNSPLSPGSIARGKLLGAWVFTLWLGVLTLPFVAAASLWGGFPCWTVPACFALNLLAGLTLASLALGLSGLFGRSLSAYLASGALLFLWVLALPLTGMLTLGLAGRGGENHIPWMKTVFALFLLHNPFAPQIWMTMRGGGGSSTFAEWGAWVPLWGVAVWLLLMLLGYRLAVRGLRREVY